MRKHQQGKEEEEYGGGRASRHTGPVRRWIIVRGRKRVPVMDPRDGEAPGGLEEGTTVHWRRPGASKGPCPWQQPSGVVECVMCILLDVHTLTLINS